MVRYYWFCLRWLWRHRYWENSRQKWKAMEKDWRHYREQAVLPK